MLAAALVIFRETLEIALILSVVMAATRGIPRRGIWALAGIGAGIAGSAVIALFLEQITQLAEGMGQEILNACVLFLAAFLIGWTVVWMRVHGKELSQRMKKVGETIKAGDATMITLSAVIALSIFREGAEIILLSNGLLASGMNITEFLEGALIGGGGGVLVGLLFYYGMMKFLTRHFFSVTGWLLILVAAGMASQGIGYLSQAGFVPVLIDSVWNSSAILSDGSALGQTLHALIGYTSQPSLIQLITYVLTIGIILMSMKRSAAALAAMR